MSRSRPSLARARPRRPTAIAAALGLLAALAAPRAAVAQQATPQDQVRAEFQAIAERLAASDDPYVGRGRVEQLRRRVAAGEGGARFLRSSIRLSEELLRLGEVQEAVGVLDRAIEAAGAGPLEGLAEAGKKELVALGAELFRSRALAHLRQAEVENCVKRHQRDCCIYPLAGGGLHTVLEPARRAREDLLRYLEATAGTRDPRDARLRLGAVWLVNVASMALGEYPDGVPAGYLVPEGSAAGEGQVPRFTDVAPSLGMDAFDLAGGVVVDDLDGDGRLDVVTTTCDPGGPMKAFRNAGDGRFEDAARAFGLDAQRGGLHLVGADYDNDGALDLFVPRGAWLFDNGRVRNSLLHNDGRGRFGDVTRAAGLAEPAMPTQTAVWGDLDDDGWLDLYVANESRVESEPQSPPYPSQLFRSRGDGTFADVAPAAGLTNDRYAKGAAVGDYDLDGDLDLYVSNLGKNRFYRNEGELVFRDVAPELGLTEPARRSFACWFFDYDEDGDLDLWVSAFQGALADVVVDRIGQRDQADRPCLYENQGDGTFRDVARARGLDHAWLAMGASFGDLDQDGWLDVCLGTGDPGYETIVPNVALRNDRGRGFVDVTRASGLGHLQKGHGIAFADVDDDGDQDLYCQLGGFFPGDAFENALFLNPVEGRRFVTLELQGVRGNRQAIGARVAVAVETPAGPRTLHRAAGCVSSFGSAPRRLEIGLGDATRIASIEVWWPTSRTLQTFTGVALDGFYRLVEGEPEPVRLTPSPVDLAAHEAEPASVTAPMPP